MKTNEREQELNEYVEKIISKFDIPLSYKGIDYLKYAIFLIDYYHNQYSSYDMYAVSLYTEVGAKFNKSYGSAERCMRYVIETIRESAKTSFDKIMLTSIFGDMKHGLFQALCKLHKYITSSLDDLKDHDSTYLKDKAYIKDIVKECLKELGFENILQEEENR